jgi:molybdopterin converting factor small subunit
MKRKIHIQYYALLREERALREEVVTTEASNALELYQELKNKHNFSLDPKSLKVAINHHFTSWKTIIKDNDQIIFIPPVAGG